MTGDVQTVSEEQLAKKLGIDADYVRAAKTTETSRADNFNQASRGEKFNKRIMNPALLAGVFGLALLFGGMAAGNKGVKDTGEIFLVPALITILGRDRFDKRPAISKAIIDSANGNFLKAYKDKKFEI